MIGELTVSIDAASIAIQIGELRGLLEGLPDGVRDSLLDRLLNLSDFGLEAETLPASRTGAYVLRFRNVALAELSAAALRALDGDAA